MITRFEAEGYGSLKKVGVNLTPLHAFIGPNDGGKSTLLAALYTLGLAVAGKPTDWFPRSGPLFGEQTPLKLSASDQRKNGIVLRRNSQQEWVAEISRSGAAAGCGAWKAARTVIPGVLPELGLACVRLLRVDPDALRQPSGLVSYSAPDVFFRNRGAGLAGVFGAILGRGDESFAAIRTEVQRLFPSIRRVGVTAVSPSELELEAELTDGSRITAAQMSDGLLCFLAFLALPHLEGTTMLLIEEIENGLHPSRTADVVRVLREVVERRGVQVILATHSPIVVNALRPEEVSIVTRPSLGEGTRVVAMTDTPDFEQRSKDRHLGELWASYADGHLESALLEPRGPKTG